METADIERSLGRIEGRMDAINIDIAALKLWEINHEQGHHGFHGKGPWGIISLPTLQTTTVTGIVVAIIEAIKSLMG